jgi:hypothetical protein
MNRLRLIAVLLLSICFSTIAKGQNVLYSPYEDFDFRSGDFSVVGMTGGRLYVYRGSSQGFFLDAYDDSMNKQATVVLDFFPQKIYQTKFIAYSDQIMVLYQALESTKVVQYAALLDASGRLKKGPLKLDEIKTGIFGATKNYFSSVVSDDKKQVTVFSANTKGKELTVEAKWIDDQLNIVKRSHGSYRADNDIAHGDAMVANDGTLYMSAYTSVGAKSYADRFWLLSLPQGAAKFTDKELPLDNLYATNAYMKVDNTNNRIYLGGFYSNKKNGSYDGLLYAYYDVAGGTFQNRKAIPFDQEMLNATGQHNTKRAFDNYQVRQLIVKNDGGFVMVSESFYILTRTSYAPGFGYYSAYFSPYMSSTIREYHYDDIMALSYNSEGVRDWSAFIPKDQYSQEDGGLFSSYALLNTGGTLAFMFNDYNSNHSRIQLAALDASGKISMHGFSAEGNDYPDWLPRSGKQVAGRVIVVPCLHKKQICFAKVVF